MKLPHLLLASALLATSTLAALADSYVVDPVHSSAVFRIKHNKTSYLYARITAPEGTIVYDAAKPEASSFDITLKAANVDTANAARDTHLKSPSFFNAKDFPNLSFKSTSVKKAAKGDAIDVTGDLTIHGVTKPLTVTLDHTGDGNMQGKPTVGFEGTFTINRSDFGMKEMLDAVGDDVRIIIAFEADKK